MCFIPKIDRENLRAEESITVYKVFRRVEGCDNDRKPHYTAPFQSQFLYDKKDGLYVCEDFGEVPNKGFHSFKEFNDAVWLMSSLERWGDYNKETFEVIPCIIPAGTPFLEGYYYTKESYLSKVIKLDY